MRVSFAILAALAVSLSAGSANAQAKQDFKLVNKTGYEIKEVYVSPSKTNDWEEDVLGSDDTLGDGEHTNIHFSRKDSTCKWDLKVVYSDDDSAAVWGGIDLCKVSQITIRYNRKSDTTSASFE